MSKSRASKTKAAGMMVNGSKYIPGYRRRSKKTASFAEPVGQVNKNNMYPHYTEENGESQDENI